MEQLLASHECEVDSVGAGKDASGIKVSRTTFKCFCQTGELEAKLNTFSAAWRPPQLFLPVSSR